MIFNRAALKKSWVGDVWRATASMRKFIRDFKELPEAVHKQALQRGIPIVLNDWKLASMKNRHKGQRCFIIGNGPSLKINDLDKLKDEITIAANKIYLAFDSTAWRPTYYNVEDPLVIEQNYSAINSLKGFTKLLRKIEESYWERDHSTLFYDMEVLPDEKFPDFSPSPLEKLFCGFSVTYTSLQFAYFMGFESIYLIGVDFSFTMPSLVMDEKLISEGEKNHFLPNYRTAGEQWFVPKLEKQQEALEFAKRWLTNRKVKVFNATRGGKLEVFPRIDFDSLFE